ncbi:MAG: hypothetical protein K6T86_14120 [Pirellulales bacterium]|nr:hypothetical protein [Pirellulales bacterium]
MIAVLFIGFDPENLAVGAVGAYESAGGIAFGAIVGAAMVAIALAFGVTALIVPMEFGQAPRSILAIPPAAVVLFGAVVWDGSLSRLDGALLLAGFVLAVLGLLWMSRRGMDHPARRRSGRDTCTQATVGQVEGARAARRLAGSHCDR